MPTHQPTASRMRGKVTSRPHWSYSQIGQFLRCPLQYYFERVAKIPRTQTPSSMLLGSMVHEALAAYHLHLQNGKTVTLQDLMPAMQATLEQSEAQVPTAYKPSETRAGLIEQGEALVELYLREAPPINILGVEQPLIVPLVTTAREVLEKPLVAIIDLLTASEEGLLVTEFKTSARKYGEAETESSLQASCYVHAVQERFNKPAAVNFAVLVKTKTPSFQRIETVRTADDFGRVGDIVQAIETVQRANGYFPIESPMNCSGCSFRQECRSWTGNHDRDQSPAKDLIACS